MSKSCDWCGEPIVKKSNRVHLPVMWKSGAPMVYHVHCYVRVFADDVAASLTLELVSLTGDKDGLMRDHAQAIHDRVDGVPKVRES